MYKRPHKQTPVHLDALVDGKLLLVLLAGLAGELGIDLATHRVLIKW